jgi:hypothetical protein
MKRTKNQISMLPDDVSRAWATSFFGIHDREQGNIMCAQARKQLRNQGYLSQSEHAAIRMRFPHLTTHDK